MAATADNLPTLVRRLPSDAVWQVIDIGRTNLELTAIGPALGGNARAGLGDTLRIGRGRLADGSTPLVQRTVRLTEALGRRDARPQDAEKALQLGPAPH